MSALTPVLADASSNLLAARSQMGFTLGFHIVLACFGVAFPAMMLIAEYRGRKRNDADALRLARNWSKAVAVLIAVGAVSGTVLSFEFGLLWPRFTGRFGGAFGVGFAIEGIFFFLEAIFIAIYIYGWDRLSPRAHLWSAVPIVISGVGGAFSVIAVNSWMNQPQGFTLDSAGKVTAVKPLEVLTNSAAGYEFLHMLLAAYMVTGFLIASVYAVGLLRGRRDRYHRLGFIIPFTVAAIATPVQLLVGDTAARAIANDQPAKFAAMECVYKGGPDQTEYLGGICTDGKVKFGIGIPGLDSFLVGFSKNTDVTGLNQIPKNDQPPAKSMLHLSFDTMVGIASLLLLLVAWFAIAWYRKRDLPATKWFLRAGALAGVAAVVALECGWIVTEVGRQPWIVNGYMRTTQAVTPAQGIWWVFGLTMALYTALGVITVLVLRGLSRRWREGKPEDVELPYSPPPDAPASGGSA
ncbi:MAG TPA: cytochrome ubiquinol oxidase subunit I [Solirubrobacterales bacterium]|jgi:cytochrome d ubiquinol oxidase subunit I|nr:cytochrome ubiquinol oxidase subunit I [Solirubrobacterales bacterium]